jgi:hypothetical protein
MNQTMTKSDVERIIFERFTPLLNEHGFKSQKSKCRFVRKTDFGFQGITFRVVTRTKFEISFGFPIRFDSIEDIWKLVSEMNPKFTKGSTTIAASIDALSDVFPMEMKISSEEELITKLSQLEESIHSIYQPYFDQFNSIDSIDVLFNSSPGERTNYLNNEELQFCKAIIAAHLNNRKDFESLVKTYRELFVNYDEDLIDERLNPLLNILRSE